MGKPIAIKRGISDAAIAPSNIKRIQHFRVTLEEAIAQYNNRCLTAKGLLLYFFCIKLRPGWEKKWTAKEILAILPIGKTSFYKYLSELKSEGKIVWEVPEETQFTIRRPVEYTNSVLSLEPTEDLPSGEAPYGEAIAKVERASEVPGEVAEVAIEQPAIEQPIEAIESNLKSCPVQKGGAEVNCTETKLRSGAKGESGIRNSVTQLLSDRKQKSQYESTIFIEQLSEAESVMFMRFIRDATRDMPTPIRNLNAWLSSSDKSGRERYKELYSQFQNSVPGQEAMRRAAKEMLTPELRSQYAREMEQRTGRDSVFEERTKAVYGQREYYVRMQYQSELDFVRDREEFLEDIKEYGLPLVVQTRGLELTAKALGITTRQLNQQIRQ